MITIHKRSDGKQSPVVESSAVLHLIPAKCVKTAEGLLMRLIRDKAGWCWESLYRDGSTQGVAPSSIMNRRIQTKI